MIGKCLRPLRRFPIASTVTGATDTPDNLSKVRNKTDFLELFIKRLYTLYTHGLLTVLFYDRD